MDNIPTNVSTKDNQFSVLLDGILSDSLAGEYQKTIISIPDSSDAWEDRFRYILNPNASSRELKKELNISTLITLDLRSPIKIAIENDDDGFIVKSLDLPLFGFGDYPNEAIENLKHEIESCYIDLMENNEFSPEWLGYKSFLRGLIE